MAPRHLLADDDLTPAEQTEVLDLPSDYDEMPEEE